jgi:hypothetical protein
LTAPLPIGFDATALLLALALLRLLLLALLPEHLPPARRQALREDVRRVVALE